MSRDKLVSQPRHHRERNGSCCDRTRDTAFDPVGLNHRNHALPGHSFPGSSKALSCRWLYAQMELIKKISEPNRCPLCHSSSASSVIRHLTSVHRRTEAEARELMEREMEGTLGWDPEVKKRNLI